MFRDRLYLIVPNTQHRFAVNLKEMDGALVMYGKGVSELIDTYDFEFIDPMLKFKYKYARTFKLYIIDLATGMEIDYPRVE